MNNIYVEGDLPDNCKTCQYKSIGRCILSDKNVFDYMVYETSPEECPVKPLSVRLKEERKKVCDEICVAYAKRLSPFIGSKISISTAMERLKEVLDQIENERGE